MSPRPHARLPTFALAVGLAAVPSFVLAQADGTPGNPAGTAAGRALDRAAGTPTAPDGTPGNPPGTAAGRAVDRAAGVPTSPDGTGNNPPGTALGRATAPALTVVPGAVTTGQTASPVLPGAAPTGQTTAPAMPGAAPTARPAMPATAAPLAPNPGAIATARPRMSQVIGAAVYNDRDERVGDVDDVLLSMPGGAAGPMAVLQVGGFLGIGGQLVVVPLSDLRWNRERERLILSNATTDTLRARAAFSYDSLAPRG